MFPNYIQHAKGYKKVKEFCRSGECYDNGICYFEWNTDWTKLHTYDLLNSYRS